MHLSTYPIIQAKQSSIHPHTSSSKKAGQHGVLSLLQGCTTGGAMFDNDIGQDIFQTLTHAFEPYPWLVNTPTCHKDSFTAQSLWTLLYTI